MRDARMRYIGKGAVGMLSGLSTYLPESALTLFDNLEFFVRLLLSAGLGALVGLERSKRQKEAGVRTHCIIAWHRPRCS